MGTFLSGIHQSDNLILPFATLDLEICLFRNSPFSRAEKRSVFRRHGFPNARASTPVSIPTTFGNTTIGAVIFRFAMRQINHFRRKALRFSALLDDCGHGEKNATVYATSKTMQTQP
jgi:hypothetical protein